MAVADGDLIQVVDFQDYLEQEILNVYYYRFVVLTGATFAVYSDLADWFEDNIITNVKAIQNGQLTHTSIEVRNLSNGLDIFTKTVSIAGTDGSGGPDAAASFLSVGFRLIRESLVTRNGYKRFAGINEANTSENQFAFPGTTEADIGAALADDVTLGAVVTFVPIIVKRPIGTPPVASYLYSDIGSAEYAGHLGSQNTRKP